MVTLESMRDSLRRREEARRRNRHARWTAAKRDFDAIVSMIERDYAPKRIYCWGSVLHPERFTETSDIDVGIEGITDPARYFELLGKAMALTDFAVDIVQLEKIDPIFSSLIRAKGRMVYERT